jgi:hypothetical protein
VNSGDIRSLYPRRIPSATRTAIPVLAGLGGSTESSHDRDILRLEAAKRGIEQGPTRHHDDVVPGRGRVPTKQFSNEPLGPITLYRAADLPCGGDPQPRRHIRPVQRENRHGAAVMLPPTIIDVLVVAPVPDMLGAPKSLIRHDNERRDGPRGSRRSLGDVPSQFDETDSRLRPFARRRFNTIRPFFVRIRTRNPWVRRRRRLLG